MGKNFKKSTAFILLIILVLSCKSNQKIEWYSEYKKEVKNIVFDKFLVKDEKTLSGYVIANYPALINENGYAAVFIDPYDNDSLSYNKRIIEIKSKSIQKIDLSEKENYFFIPVKEEVRENKIPLPDLDQKDLKNFLDVKEPVFYITDNNPGKFLINEKNYNYKDSIKNDFKWKHGYTNGAFIDEKNKKIVYYLMIW
jgi:hypothetical protein